MEDNLTPDQRLMPLSVHRVAFKAIPQTCGNVRGILDEAMYTIMQDLEIPAEETAAVDASISRAFQRIRDEVTQPFRTAQMRLIWQIQERADGSVNSMPRAVLGETATGF